MTVEQLIELLKKLPPKATINIFDPEQGERIDIDPWDPIDHWDDYHADINLNARTEFIK